MQTPDVASRLSGASPRLAWHCLFLHITIIRTASSVVWTRSEVACYLQCGRQELNPIDFGVVPSTR